jgi:spore maturation protein SpmA
LALNYIWISFFLIALLVACVKTFAGDVSVFSDIVKSTFDMASVSFEISIGLTGVLCLWLGIMKIGERGGAVSFLAKFVGPFFNKLFPDVPSDHPARGAMLMNFSANMLGLDNAATPMGLKAMKDLQELNLEKDKASNAMIMFLVLNTSGLTLIPVAVMNYRNQFGANSPSDVFIPILIATFIASIVGLITIAIYQKINLLDKVILAYLGGITLFVVGMIVYFTSLTPEELTTQSALISNITLYGIICAFILMAIRKKVNVYESFIEGAKDGFGIAVKIIPYLVAILVSIGVFRASGAMDILVDGFKWFFSLFFADTRFVDGLPTAFMKPLSGNGARGMMLESYANFGVDSYVAKLTSTLQGATDTTFYIIAVYFGSVRIRKTRYAVKAGLIADLGGIIAAIIIATFFFGGENIKKTSPIDQVSQFSEAWIKEDIPEYNFVANDLVLFDQALDTVAKNKSATLKYLEESNLLDITAKIHTVSEKEKLPDAKILVKFKSLSNQRKTFEFQYNGSGKINSIQYLGNF